MIVAAPASDPVLFAADAFELPMRPSTRFSITIYEAADGLRKAVLAVAAEAAERPRRRFRRMPEPSTAAGRGCRLFTFSDRKIAARLPTRCPRQVE
jgi:hypothetical protein